MHSKAFHATIHLSHAAKSLNSLGNSAWGGVHAEDFGQQDLGFATDLKNGVHGVNGMHAIVTPGAEWMSMRRLTCLIQLDHSPFWPIGLH